MSEYISTENKQWIKPDVTVLSVNVNTLDDPAGPASDAGAYAPS